VIWVGTDAGLKRVDPSGVVAVDDPSHADGRAVWSIAADGANGLWIGTRLGALKRFRDGKFEHVPLAPWMKTRTILALARDRHGNLWIGSDGDGLARCNAGGMSVMNTRSGLSNQIIRAIYEDREGTVWIGTAGGGLNRLRDQRLKALSMREGMPTDVVRSAYEDAQKNMWLGTGAGTVRVKHGRNRVFDERHGLPGPVILPVFRDREGNVWAGGSQDRVVMYPRGHISRKNARCLLNGVSARAFYHASCKLVIRGLAPTHRPCGGSHEGTRGDQLHVVTPGRKDAVMAPDVPPSDAKRLADRCRGIAREPVMMFSEIYVGAPESVKVHTRHIEQQRPQACRSFSPSAVSSRRYARQDSTARRLRPHHCRGGRPGREDVVRRA
jgi:ligand-binding sensor domain-containing protein